MEFIKCNSATILVTGREAAYAEPTFVFRTSAWEVAVSLATYWHCLQTVLQEGAQVFEAFQEAPVHAKLNPRSQGDDHAQKVAASQHAVTARQRQEREDYASGCQRQNFA